MKNLKVVILVFAILGLVAMFLPMGPGEPSTISWLMEASWFQLGLMLVAFASPIAVCALGLAKPPSQDWHGTVALAGFALAAVKTRIWETLPHIADVPLSATLMAVAVVGGGIMSFLTVVKPESKA